MPPQNPSRRWTPEEDALLTNAVMSVSSKTKNWMAIAEQVPNRSNTQCRQRWTNSLAPDLVKGKWTNEDDEKLKELVMTSANINWGEIAVHFNGRNNAQVRARWENYLNPNIKKKAFSAEEIEILEREVANRGNQWAEIARVMPGRTAEQVCKEYLKMYPEFKGDPGRPGKKRPISEAIAQICTKTSNDDTKDISLDEILASFTGLSIQSNKKPKLEDLIDSIDATFDDISEESTYDFSSVIQCCTDPVELYSISSILGSLSYALTPEEETQDVIDLPQPTMKQITIRDVGDHDQEIDDDEDIGDDAVFFC